MSIGLKMFIETSQEYKSFITWLKKVIYEKGKLEYQKWTILRDNIEKVEMPASITDVYKQGASVMPEFRRSGKKTKSKNTKHHKTNNTKAGSEEVYSLRQLIEKRELKIEVRELGTFDEEAFFDKERGTLIVNSSNPSYVFARSHGRLQGVAYHIFKAASVLIALESANNLEEFKSIYNAISRNIDLLDGLDKSLRKR